MHPLAARQLRRFFQGDEPDARVRALLAAVSEAYQAADEDRAQLENSLALAAEELRERLVALQEDVRRRENAERERDAFFSVSPDLLGILDSRFTLVQFNPAWTRVLGYPPEELANRNLLEWLHPEDRERTLEAGKALGTARAIVDFENRYRDRAGRWLTFSWAVTSTHTGLYYCVGRDVTGQRALQRDLAQAQKLEAVGQLAAGVAHEINTPMQFIGDNVHFAADAFRDLLGWLGKARAALAGGVSPKDLAELRQLEKDADLDFLLTELPGALNETRDGVRRVAELVKALKEFAHPDRAEMTSEDLNHALERTLVLARGALKHVARVETAFGDVPDVRCHVGLLNQVFLNLLVNAAHAIEDKHRRTGRGGMGDIRVTTRVDSGAVVVSISDSGCGIPEALRERIFEPFFTTKEVGRGSGQGLPLIRSIVDRHGGTLTFDTELDVGTTFHVRLPLLQLDVARSP